MCFSGRCFKENERGQCTNEYNHWVDNRKINLRVCTTQENLRNKSPKVNRLNSKYKGVYYTDACGSKHWVTCIRCNYKQIHIGYYHSQEEAALAYNEKAKELFGEFARLNEVIVC